ncbi:MAG: hypothetical protein GY847_14275 [Proteobacteria bacterium]|nr:hypothetical protein [Pseudomonadota bacterium]
MGINGEILPPCSLDLNPGVGGLQPGTYRVMDGVLCRVLHGLPLDDVELRLASGGNGHGKSD